MSSFMRPERGPLTEEERKPLEWLLANCSPDAKPSRSQIVDAVGKCTCGCYTLDLALADREQRKTMPSIILADFAGKTAEGIEVGAIVCARGRKISEPEIYGIASVNGPFNLPRIESLEQF